MLAFTFPGQGSQRSGMGAAWADHPSWEIVQEASEVAGRDLAGLLVEASMETLTLTANAQLATMVQSLVVLDAVERLGIAPSACAGHSLGEYTALVASGAISFEDGIRMVIARGEAMNRAAEDAPGTMAAVLGLSDDDAEAACQRAEGDAWVANYNAPGQVVIAGTHEAVTTASKLAKEMGGRRVLPIPVSGAFHTPLMGAARPALRKALDDARFSAPEVAVVANVDARVHDDPAQWPNLLSAQLCSPVRWRQSVEALSGLGITTLVELGPGGVLSGLARRIVPETRAHSVSAPTDLDALMDAAHGLGDALDSRSPPRWRAPLHDREGRRQPVRRHLPARGGHRRSGHGSSQGHDGPLLRLGRRRGRHFAQGDGSTPVLKVGQLVGRVGVTDVRTPFAGAVVNWLADAGDRVHPGQPLLWITRLRGARVSRRARARRDGHRRLEGNRGGLRALVLGVGRPRRHNFSQRQGRLSADAAPDRLLSLACDVRDPDQVETAFQEVESTWAPVEVLVANAGITRDALVLRMGEDDWREVLDTNLAGAWRVAKRAVGRMVRARRGRIILVSSVSAFVGLPGQANYAASKAGMVGMARALAREVASRGITVNVVAPGVVETDMVAALGEARVEELRRMVPLGRTGNVGDVAAAVGFLASEGASYVTGAILPVDGGLGMGL